MMVLGPLAGQFVQAAGADGIPVGKWLFYPSLEASWLSEDNLFLQPENPESATSLALRPNLAWELPFRESHFKIEYSPQLRTFLGRESDSTSGLNKKTYSHFVEAETVLVFSNDLRMELRDRLIIDTFEAINRVTGGELPFNNEEYVNNTLFFEVVKGIGIRHGVGIEVNHELLSFDNDDNPVFVDYRLSQLALQYVYRLSPLTQVKVSFGLGKGEQDRALGTGAEVEEFDNREWKVRLQGVLGRDGLADGSIGYLRWDFIDPTEDDFGGLTVNFHYRLFLSDRINLSTRLYRRPFQSFFQSINFYISNGAEFRVIHEPGRHLFYTSEIGYRLNDYREEAVSSDPSIDGLRRRDKIWNAALGIGYKFNDSLKLELRYRHDQRSSNLSRAEYQANRMVLSLSYGWI